MIKIWIKTNKIILNHTSQIELILQELQTFSLWKQSLPMFYSNLNSSYYYKVLYILNHIFPNIFEADKSFIYAIV